MKRIKILVKEIAAPLGIALLMGILFKSVYCRDGEINYLFAWILIGFPFGIRKMWLLLMPRGRDLGATIGIFVLNIVVGGLIGGVTLIVQLITGTVKIIRGRS